MHPPHNYEIVLPPQEPAVGHLCLQQVAAGDERAFAKLYKNMYPPVYNYIFLLTRNEATTEDVVQEVFFKLWRYRKKLPAVKHPAAFIYRMAKNEVIDSWRKEARDQKVKNEAAHLAPSFTDNGCFASHGSLVVERVVRALPPRQQAVYRLVREGGYKREEVSRALKVSPSTVKATLQQAMQKVREGVKRDLE